MTRDMFKTLIAALLAAGFSQPLLSAPAHAGGSVSLTYAPANAQDAGVLATGLRAYSLYRGWRSARIRRRPSSGVWFSADSIASLTPSRWCGFAR